MRSIALFLLIALLTAGSAQAAPLGNANFTANITGYTTGWNYTEWRQTLNTPFLLDTGVQTDPGGGSFQVIAELLGGSTPTARVEGWRLPSATPGLDLGIAAVFYEARAAPAPGFAPALAGSPVPVTFSGFASAELFPLPGPTLLGFAEATVRLTGVGVDITEGASAIPAFPQLVNSFSHSISAIAGTALRVNLSARGNAAGQWLGIADPVFEIDPTATFVYQGQTYLYADAFEFEYSLGIVPEPSTAVMLVSGLIGLAVIGQRRKTSGHSTTE